MIKNIAISFPRQFKKMRDEREVTNIENAGVVIITEPTNMKGDRKSIMKKLIQSNMDLRQNG